jgi:serine/threonine protein phosphatase PrpC
VWVKIRIRGAGGLWRILIVSFMIIVESRGKGTLPSSSESPSTIIGRGWSIVATLVNMLPSGVVRTSTRSATSSFLRRGADIQYLLDATLSHPDQAVPDLLNKTFQVVDSRLSALAASGKTQSGCTAVTAFLRVEQDLENEPKGFTNPNLTARGLMHGKGEDELEAQTSLSVRAREDSIGASSSGDGTDSGLKRKMSGRRIRNFVKGLTSSGSNEEAVEDDGIAVSASDGSRVDAIDPKSQSDKPLKRVLYTANVGDARAVLSYVTHLPVLDPSWYIGEVVKAFDWHMIIKAVIPRKQRGLWMLGVSSWTTVLMVCDPYPAECWGWYQVYSL